MKKNFEKIFNDARNAAETACAEWFESAKPRYVIKDGQRPVGVLLDVCAISGGSVDGRSAFAKWLVKSNPERYGRGNFYGIAYDLLGKYRHKQEMGAQEAGLKSARAVLAANGIKVRLWTNID